MQDHDVVAIGNALVDVIAQCDDAFLAAHGRTKGSMALVDTPTVEKLYAAMGPGIEMSGGSAANTMVGVASLGGKSAFIGKTATDQLGEVFRHDIRAAGVTFDTPPAGGGEPTGRSLILVTPDGQRTMNTFLGVSPQLGSGEVSADLIRSGRILYLEGYLFDRPEAQEAYWKASRVAHEAGRRVSLTLSDTFCVERHREAWRLLVTDQVDVLFANEGEAMALYEVDTLDEVIRHVQAEVEITAITCGPRGSLVVHGDTVTEVPAHPVPKVVDTTGAGDLYAAGFLFGLTNGRSLEACGRLGSVAASAVLGHTGARPGLSLAQTADSMGL